MAKSDKPSVNKADFVRSIGLDVRAKDVVQKAAAAGFSLSEAYVYGVRKEMSAKGPAAKSADKAKTAKSAPAPKPAVPAKRGPSGPRAGSKKAFVLSFPTDTPARDILAAASLKGMEMSAGYVYWVRSDATRNGRRAAAAPTASPAARPAAPTRFASGKSNDATARTRGSEAERLIVDTAIRVVGIERAIAILEAARGKLDRLIADLSPPFPTTPADPRSRGRRRVRACSRLETRGWRTPPQRSSFGRRRWLPHPRVPSLAANISQNLGAENATVMVSSSPVSGMGSPDAPAFTSRRTPRRPRNRGVVLGALEAPSRGTFDTARRPGLAERLSPPLPVRPCSSDRCGGGSGRNVAAARDQAERARPGVDDRSGEPSAERASAASRLQHRCGDRDSRRRVDNPTRAEGSAGARWRTLLRTDYAGSSWQSALSRIMPQPSSGASSAHTREHFAEGT